MRTILTVAAFLLVSGGFAQPDAEPETIEVRMVDKSSAEWRFVPSDIKARRGDTVRFVLEDIVPHNVEFTDVPEGSNLGAVKMGPFLMQKGQTYEIAIDDRFALGTHKFVCTPHAAMGMKGSMEVVSANTVFSTD